MNKRGRWLAGATALITAPLMALTASTPALAIPCTIASVLTYVAHGFSCTVDNVLFSNINISPLSTKGGFVELGNFTPFSTGNFSGLSMNFIAATGAGPTSSTDIAAAAGAAPNSSTDIAWTYNVSALDGFLLQSVFASVVGNTVGTGGIFLSEVLSNGVMASLNGAGSTMATFAPVASLLAAKDQFNFAGPDGFAATSIMQNGYGVVAVPGPIAGAGLPALLALGGFVWARRRKAPAMAA